MKKLLFTGILILLIASSCEKNDHDIFFKIGNDFKYKLSDIELYDTSTHMMYFKTEHDEFKNLDQGTDRIWLGDITIKKRILIP